MTKPSRAFLWSAIVALAFTLVMLQWSYDRFRLHSAPFLDDVNWIDEGLEMLASVRDGGIAGFFHHLNAGKTLAPYSIVAAAGFAIFGIHDWVPYLMNGWLIFALLAFIELVRRRTGLAAHAWFFGAALALAFPICGYSIVSFLGDQASGLFIAMGSIAFLEGWPASKYKLESWAGTFAWIFAFYGKATLFPETMLLFLLTAATGWVTSRQRDMNFRWILRVVVVLVAVLPYYGLVARSLGNYLFVSNWGDYRQVWAFKGTIAESLLYYVTGFSGETMLGPALYLALVVIALRIALDRLRFVPTLLVIAIAYALPTYMVNKTPTVAAPFQFLIVLTAVTSLYTVLERMPRYTRAIGFGAAAAVLLLARFPQALDHAGSPAVAARNHTMTGLITALEKQEVQRDESVFLTTTGYVSVNTLKYEFLKRKRSMPRFFELSVATPDPAPFRQLIDQASLVIATEAGNDEVFYTTPSAFVQGDTLAMVQQNPLFTEVARFNTWRGKHYYLFSRGNRVKALDAPTASMDLPLPGPRWLEGVSDAGPDHRRWSHRDFDIEFPAPRGLYAELTLRFFLPQTHIDKLGSITLSASIAREGRHTERYSNEGVHEFKFRYAIKQHLVSTVAVRFHLNKTVPSGDLGILIDSVALNPVPNL